MREHRNHHQLAHGLFAVCSSSDIAAIRRAGTEVTVPAGTVIHEQGRRAQWAYVVLDGLARLTAAGRSRTLAPGDVHGARALLAGEEWCGELTAETKLRLLVVDRSHFVALMSHRAGFAHGVARYLAVDAA